MQLRPSSAVLLGAMVCLACTNEAPDDLDGGPSGGDAALHDAALGDAAQADAGSTLERDGGTSVASDGGAQDASASALDASAPMEAGQPASDGGTRDSATPTTDAGGGSGQSLRAKVCGAEQNFASPLPPEGQRTAQPVGTMSFGFLEGPLWLAEPGVLLFSDMDFSGGNAMGPPARIRRLMPPTTFSPFAPSNSNGLALYTDGRILAATHDNQGLSWFDVATGMKTPIAVQSGGKSLHSPNDLAVRSDGTVYFTDPDYQRGSRPEVTKVRGVYRLKPPLMTSGTNEATLLDGTLTQPNGVALSPDEKTLYVGSSGAEIWKFAVAADGSVSDRAKFATPGASDGLTVDCAGNLYVTSGEVEVFAPDGMRLGGIAVADGPTNVAFGGADRKTLYITAGPRLYSIRLNVPGFPY